jgi:hypothetical protein
MGNRSTRWLALSLLPLLAGAVAAQDAAEQKIVVIDLRPPEQREGTGLKELEGKCNEDVYRIADVASDPLKVDVLREDLSQLRLNAPKTLTVLDWSIYYNKQVQGNKGTGLRSVGVGGYTIPTGQKKERRAGSRCTKRDTAGGWYEGAELHSVYFPLISEFSGTYGGRPVTVRVVYSPSKKLAGKFEGGADDTEALIEVVHQTSGQVADLIAR